jgi:hypothetical protein
LLRWSDPKRSAPRQASLHGPARDSRARAGTNDMLTTFGCSTWPTRPPLILGGVAIFAIYRLAPPQFSSSDSAGLAAHLEFSYRPELGAVLFVCCTPVREAERGRPRGPQREEGLDWPWLLG